jgi:trigger factor
MQVVTERLPKAVAKISVTIDQNEVSQAMDRAFKRVVTQYNIPGFRRGKVPRPIFERMVGPNVIWQAAAEDLVDDRYPKALSESGIVPVSEPNIQIGATGLTADAPFSFVIEVQVKPLIELGDYQDVLKEPLVIPEVTDERLDEEMNQVARSQAQLVPADDEAVAAENQVVLDLKGFLEEPEEGDDGLFAEDEDYTVQIGSGTTVEGLDEQLIGLKVGEPATIRLTYPEEHPDVDLAGKAVRFEVTVKQNKRLEVPPIDDDLAKALEYDSLEALRTEVAKRLAERLKVEAQDERLQGILGKLRERLSFEVPDSLVQEAIKQRLQDVQNNLARMDITLEQYLETRQITLATLEEEVRPAAEGIVRDQLLLEAVAREQGFLVSDEEVIDAIRPVAEMYRQPLADFVQLFRQQGEFEQIRAKLLNQRASEFLATTVVE